MIKTPPPLPSEILTEKEKNEKEKINEIRRKAAGEIIGISLVIGAIVAFILTYLINENSYSSHQSNEYYVFHSSAEYYDHSISYWHIFPYILLIVEVIALIIAGIKIAIIKPSSVFERNYNTDLGKITILQQSASYISINDKVLYVHFFLREKPFPGKYTFESNEEYDFIIVEGLSVKSIQKHFNVLTRADFKE